MQNARSVDRLELRVCSSSDCRFRARRGDRTHRGDADHRVMQIAAVSDPRLLMRLLRKAGRLGSPSHRRAHCGRSIVPPLLLYRPSALDGKDGVQVLLSTQHPADEPGNGGEHEQSDDGQAYDQGGRVVHARSVALVSDGRVERGWSGKVDTGPRTGRRARRPGCSSYPCRY